MLDLDSMSCISAIRLGAENANKMLTGRGCLPSLLLVCSAAACLGASLNRHVLRSLGVATASGLQ